MLQNSVGILLRFCLNKIAVVSDIEKAFQQIGLKDNAKDATRFFWLKDKKILGTDNNIQPYRFCRPPFGIIASPFLLAATIDHHLQTVGTRTAENIRQNINVDNVVTGTNSVHEALGFYSESKKIFEGAAIYLRDWTSKIKEVLDKIPLYYQTNRREMKILGLLWHVEEDNMTVTYHMSNNMTISKRTVLSRKMRSIELKDNRLW